MRLLTELPEQELGEQAANAVGLLALVAGQDVEPAEESDGRDGRWRIARRTVADRMISTVDPEARHVHKTRSYRQEGFKAHIAIEPETGLITAAVLTPGAGPEHHEATVALDLLDDEPAGLQIFGDTAYSSDATCGALAEAGHELFCKPAPLKTAVVGGYSLDDFAIDTTAGTVTCPAGHQVVLGEASGIHMQRRATFTEQCLPCPLRQRCTKAKAGRVITIRPNHDQQAATRHRASTDLDWQATYRRWRPPVEDGIRFNSLSYIAPEIRGHKGQVVQVRYMPHDDRFIEVYLDGVHLCTAVPADRMTAAQTEAFRAHQRAEAKRLGAEKRRATRRAKTVLAPLTGEQTAAEETTVVPARKARAAGPNYEAMRAKASASLLGLHRAPGNPEQGVLTVARALPRPDRRHHTGHHPVPDGQPHHRRPGRPYW